MGGEHLVPVKRGEGFVGVRTGKRYDEGYLVYLGKDVSLEEITLKLGTLDQAYADILEDFLSQLGSLKIGNVVQWTADGKLKIIKARIASGTSSPKLP